MIVQIENFIFVENTGFCKIVKMSENFKSDVKLYYFQDQWGGILWMKLKKIYNVGIFCRTLKNIVK